MMDSMEFEGCPASRVTEGQLSFDEFMPGTGERLQALWHRWRGFIGKLALAGALGGAAGAAAAPAIMPAEILVGPHDGTVQPNLSGQLVLDLGPGDTITRPSGQVFGGTIVLKGLHGDDSSEGAGISDLETYANLFDVEKITDDAMTEIRKRAEQGGVVGAMLFAGSFAALYASYGERRRKELAEGWQRRKGVLLPAGAAAAVAVGAGASGLIMLNNNASEASASQDLSGTPLEDWTINSSLLRSGVAEFIKILNRNEDTSEKFKTNLNKEAKERPILQADKDSFTVVVVGNTKCDMVLPASIGELTKKSKATYFIAAGDMVFSGSSLENPCVTSLAFHTQNTRRVAAMGNHSSDQTEQAAKDEDFTVLDREVVELDGKTFLGDDSPRRSGFIQGTHQEREETESEMGAKIADKACRQKEPMFAIVFNEPHAAEHSAERGCATLVVAASEESSLVELTRWDGKKTWYFLAGDATGTQPGSVNLGEPDALSEVTVLKFNKETSVLEAEQTVRFFPDTQVEIPQPQLFYDDITSR